MLSDEWSYRWSDGWLSELSEVRGILWGSSGWLIRTMDILEYFKEEYIHLFWVFFDFFCILFILLDTSGTFELLVHHLAFQLQLQL